MDCLVIFVGSSKALTSYRLESDKMANVIGFLMGGQLLKVRNDCFIYGN